MKGVGLELFVASIGLFILALASVQAPEERSIDSVDASDIGEKITLEGEVRGLHSTEDAAFAELEEGTGSIHLVAFEDDMLREGSLTVSGRVDLYQGDIQLIVEEASAPF